MKISIYTLLLLAAFNIFGNVYAQDVGMNLTRVIEFSPDGQLVAIGTQDGQLDLVTSSTRQFTSLRQNTLNAPVVSIDWSPDGNAFVVGGGGGLAEIWSAQGQLIRTLPVIQTGVSDVDWSPNGALIVTDDYESGTTVWDAETGVTVAGINYSATNFARWSPNGELLMTGGYGIVIRTVPSYEISLYAGEDYLLTTANWNNSGNLVAFGSGETDINTYAVSYSVRVLDITSGSIYTIVEGLPNYVSRVEWSADDSAIIASTSDGLIRVYDSATGRQLDSYNVGLPLYAFDYLPENGTIYYPNERPEMNGLSAQQRELPLVSLQLNSLIEDSSSVAVEATQELSPATPQ